MADGLRDLLADRFLGGTHKTEQLSFVAELAASEASLGAVQDYIASLLANLKPAEFHQLLPTFRWRAIATTNYDLLIETVYQKVEAALQSLVPIVDTRDRVDDRLRGRNQLAFLKLHGCITRTQDDQIPLILSPDQYVTHRKGRSRLYDMLKEFAYENPFVFIGHSLGDSDIRTLLLELEQAVSSRPRSYLVRPGLSEAQERFWSGRRVTPLRGTFEDFLRAAEVAIPSDRRQLLTFKATKHPIEKLFRVKEPVGGSMSELLEHDAEYVYPGMSVPADEAGRFYRGFDLGWYPIEAGLDVRRGLTDRLLQEVVIRPEEDRPTVVELYAVTAEAGAGKSLLIRRVAWEAASDAGELCLFVRTQQAPRLEALKELQRCTDRRLFLFWDDASDNVAPIADLIVGAREAGLRLTVITAERRNQWNISCEELDRHLSDEFKLHYLNETEVEALVGLLEENDCLDQLRQLTHEQRIQQFVKQAGRQILVALHEATLGRPFQDIIFDEYNEIQPDSARRLYRTVCVLNRFKIPVRAGLISRVHGVPLRAFRERFLLPLEHVVCVKEDRASGDFRYQARHPEIAEIVFDRALREPEDRYDEYIRLLADLNLAYSVDLRAFRRLLRAHDLTKLFPSRQDVDALYDAAIGRAPEDPYLLQQRAIFERLRDDGSLRKARQLLDRARSLAPRDRSIVHSLAEVVRAEALEAPAGLRRQKLRGEARALLGPLLGAGRDSLYAQDALIKISLDELQDLLRDDGSSDRDIDSAVRNAERRIHEAGQRHPNEQRFLTAEAALSDLIDDHDRALKALERAFAKNSRDPFIAGRLARSQLRRGLANEAEETIRLALEGNRGDQTLNYRYAELVRKRSGQEHDALIYHYRRAFTPNDRNFEAQFWYARYAFESDNEVQLEESKAIFRALRTAPMRLKERHRIRDFIMTGDHRATHTGTVSRLDEQHGFIQRDGIGDWIFFHRRRQGQSQWRRLLLGSRAAFEIGFSFSGPEAVGINVL